MGSVESAWNQPDHGDPVRAGTAVDPSGAQLNSPRQSTVLSLLNLTSERAGSDSGRRHTKGARAARRCLATASKGSVWTSEG